jgi:hypothetical protein
MNILKKLIVMVLLVSSIVKAGGTGKYYTADSVTEVNTALAAIKKRHNLIDEKCSQYPGAVECSGDFEKWEKMLVIEQYSTDYKKKKLDARKKQTEQTTGTFCWLFSCENENLEKAYSKKTYCNAKNINGVFGDQIKKYRKTGQLPEKVRR